MRNLMSSYETRALIEAIKLQNMTDDVAMMMECAVDSWQLSNNAFPYGFDLLARGIGAAKKAQSLSSSDLHLFAGKRRLCFEGEFGGRPLRVWLRVAGASWKTAKPRPNREGVLCVDPYLNLDLMAASPDARYILEQRAGLAACLFVDEMPEDQLREFIDHIRMV